VKRTHRQQRHPVQNERKRGRFRKQLHRRLKDWNGQTIIPWDLFYLSILPCTIINRPVELFTRGDFAHLLTDYMIFESLKQTYFGLFEGLLICVTSIPPSPHGTREQFECLFVHRNKSTAYIGRGNISTIHSWYREYINQSASDGEHANHIIHGSVDKLS